MIDRREEERDLRLTKGLRRDGRRHLDLDAQLGQDVPGFGTTDVSKWGYQPATDQNWDDLDPLAQAAGVVTHCGASASQNRSTFMMAIDADRHMTGQDVLPPGQSGFISAAGVPSPHLCDQVSLFDTFTYKNMPPA